MLDHMQQLRVGFCVVSGTIAFGAITLNGVALVAFFRYIQKKSLRDILRISMAFGDLLQACLGYFPELIIVSVGVSSESIMFCKVASYLVTFFGLSTLSHLSVLSGEMYLNICRPYLADQLLGRKCYKISLLFGCWIYPLFWATIAFTGWASYGIETDSRCSINWTDKSIGSVTYIISLFIFCFVLPLVIILFSLISVQKEVSQLHKRMAEKSDVQIDEPTLRCKRRTIRLTTFMVLSFVVVWLPYSAVAISAAFLARYQMVVAPEVFIVTASLAKLSSLLNPIIYTLYGREFRRQVLQMLCQRWLER